MERGDYVFGAIFLAIVGGLSAASVQKIGTPDREAAVASAVRHTLAQMIGEDVIDSDPEGVGSLSLCLTTEVKLDVAEIGSALTRTIIRPIPIKECSSRTVEGDFGMFSALTYYYAPNGDEAGHFKIADIVCQNSNMCVVDIDSHAWGERYWMERSGEVWTVKKQRNRWIV